jgi:hypothetical protein
MSWGALVYLLCFLTSLTCAALMLRGFRLNGSRLLLWAGLGFCAMTLNNLLLVADMVVWRDMDLWAVRQLSTALSIGVFLYGFLWEVER